MIHILHSIGWAVVAWVIGFPAILILKILGLKMKPPVFWVTAIAFAVFLLTL